MSRSPRDVLDETLRGLVRGEDPLGQLAQEARRLLHAGTPRLALRALKTREAVLLRRGIPKSDEAWGLGWEVSISALRYLGELDAAADLAERVVHTGTQASWGITVPRTLTLLGRIHLEQSRIETATVLFDRARVLYREMDDDVGEGTVLIQLGAIAERQGLHRRALDLHERAQQTFSQNRGRSDPFLAQSYLLAANVRQRLGQLEDSLTNISQAIELFDTLGIRHGQAESRWVLGNLHLRQGRAADALSALHEGLALVEETAFEESTARILNSLGEVTRFLGLLDDSEAYYARALAHTEKQKSGQSVLVQFNLALVQVLRQEYGIAAESLEQVRRTLEEQGRLTLAAAARIALLPCAAATGDWRAWDANYEAGIKTLSAAGFFDVDIAWAARQSGTICGLLTEEPEHLARATRSLELAIIHWRGLSRPADIQEDARALRVLSMRGATVPMGPFDIEEPLGSGAMGEVWRGVHRTTGTPVAIKVMTHEAARSDVGLTAFTNEVRAMAGLSHPHIAMVLDHGIAGQAAEIMTNGRILAGSPFFAMELAEQGSLEAWCGRLDWPQCRRVLLDLLEALSHAHARGVIHRDLKPGNVLLFEGETRIDPLQGISRDTTCRLADFGLAHALASNDHVGLVAGTPQYMAPEQFRGWWRDFGPWTDLYALGCLAWQLVSGLPPFGERYGLPAVREAQLHIEPPDLNPRIAVPPGLEAWLRRLLRKEHLDRYPLATQARRALLTLGDATRPAQPGDQILPEVSPRTWRSMMVFEAEEAPPEDETAEPPQKPIVPPTFVPSSWRTRRGKVGRGNLAGAGIGLFGLRKMPLLGRRNEQNVLWSNLRLVAADRQAHLTVIRGPTGCGKTRLAEWFAEAAQSAACALVLSLSGPEVRRTTLKRLLSCEGLSGNHLTRRIHRVLRTHGLLDPDLAQRVAVFLEPNGQVALSLEEVRTTFLRVLALFATERIVVLILDDAHESNEALDVAQELLESPLQVMSVLCVREEDLLDRTTLRERIAAAEATARTSVLEVGPLADQATRDLVHRHLRLEGALADWVTSRTGGNPQFAVQIVQDWIDRGSLESCTGGFKLRPGVRRMLPDSLHDLWSERRQTLVGDAHPNAIRALELAAVLGQRVRQHEWEAVCQAAGLRIPDEIVDRLLQVRLAERTPQGWRFTHGPLQESLLRAARDEQRLRDHHETVASVLKDAPSDLLGDQAARLGRHLLRAGRSDDALTPLLEAARKRLTCGHQSEVVDILNLHKRALVELAVRDSDLRNAPREALFAELAFETGDLDLSEARSERLIAMGRRFGWRHEVAFGHLLLGRIGYARGERTHSRKRLRTAYVQARALKDRRLEGSALFGLAILDRSIGDHQHASERMHDAHAAFAKAGDAEGLARSSLGLGSLASRAGDHDAALKHYRAALHGFREVRATNGVALCLDGMGDLARRDGDLDTAEQNLQEALAMFRATGSRDAIVPMLNLVLVHFARASWDTARDLLANAQRAMETEGRMAILGTVHALALVVYATNDDPREWQKHLMLGRALLEQTGEVEAETAHWVEVAAERARACGEHERCQSAKALAKSLYKRLGDEHSVERLSSPSI